MALTQDHIAQQMVAQLRVLDPSISAEVGTPERKIIDTVAQALAEAQVDLNLTSGALDLTAKFGSDLDAFVGLFGFGRQAASLAQGFVTLSRGTPSSYDIIIPTGTQVQGSGTSNGAAVVVTFQTTAAVTLAAGAMEVIAPIQALVAGSQANLAADTITQFANLGAPPLGITAVNNDIPTSGGTDQESDAELKVRFRNTVFRNVAGTEDQYMALAVATQYSTKANVLGPISRYREYMQIPDEDDSVETEDGPGHGYPGLWTTTPSNNPYAKTIYLDLPYFVSNGEVGAATIFYRQDIDFVVNAPPVDAGDTYREAHEDPPDLPRASSLPTNPNITFFNVYTGDDENVTQPRPDQIVLLEYAYLSTESRNDVDRNITNCVDVFVNGENPTTADAALATPQAGLNLFNLNLQDKLYANNYRRTGEPDIAPNPGNIFQSVFWQPMTVLPDQIIVGDILYTQGQHYWAVEDKTLIGNTIRSRNGIEWNPTQVGTPIGDSTPTTIVANPATSFTLSGYTYDRNVVDLQTALDGSKQITTDVLAHRATRRYYKLDLTVVYTPGAGVATTNQAIHDAIESYFAGQYFGTTIQLSDLLLIARNVFGVQNVRWTNDVLNPADLLADLGGAGVYRVTECDRAGEPRGITLLANTAGAPGALDNVLTSVFYSGPTVPQIMQVIGDATFLPPQTYITDITGSTLTISQGVNYTDTSHPFRVKFVNNSDFILRDNELPALPDDVFAGDTLPGLIIRPRAQNTFNLV